MMKDKPTYLWIGIGVVVAVFVIGIAFWGGLDRAVPPRLGDRETPRDLAGATAVAPGTSLVTKEGEVVTPEGKLVDNSALPASPEGPKQSEPITTEELPANAVKLSASMAGGFSPKTFSARAGEVVTLSLTSGDGEVYVLQFRDSSLSAVAIGVGPNETRAITFNAPDAGEYEFYSSVPGHIDAGLVGTMRVR